MASMIDSDAFERKIGAIYAAVDGNNFKSAIKLTDAALKKYKRHQTLRALRAYALQRSGRGDDALAALRELAAEGADSEQVLHVMSLAYRAAGRAGDITPAYAAAAERHPADVDILIGLFGAYAKELNFVKQQHTALRLAKADPARSARYGWWAACCAALQARATLRAAPDSKLGQLAETMAARQVERAGGGAPTFEALLLYVDILQGLGKSAEAAAAVERAPAVAAGLAGDRAQMLAAAHARGGALDAAAPLYLAAALQNPDDWMTWHLYLDCTLPGSAALPVPGTSRFPVGVVGGLADLLEARLGLEPWREAAARQDDAAVQDALRAAAEAVQQLQAAAAGGAGGARGAALAAPELALRRLRLGLPGAERQLAEAVAEAFPALATLFSCAADLRLYLASLRGADVCAWLTERVQQAADEAAAVLPVVNGNGSGDRDGIRRLQARVNAHCVLAELGLPALPSAEAAMEHAVGLLSLYAEHLPLSENLDPKERGFGEELVALAAGALVSACRVVPSAPAAPALLLSALLALEAAQHRRHVSAPLRLASVALCSLLGAPRLAAGHLSALDVKSILHDTMTGHWLLPALLGAGFDAELSPWLAGLRALHRDQVAEAADALLTVYEQETYSKVAEFVDFRERLGRSHTRAVGQAETAAQALRAAASPAGGKAAGATALRAAAAEQAVEAGPALALATLQELRFNEDLSTRPAWFPPARGPPRLALAAWWEEAAAATPGYAHCWWSPIAAAEREGPEAEAWREAARGALRQRHQLPALLAAVLQERPLGADDAQALVSLTANLQTVAQRAEPGGSAEALVGAAHAAVFDAGLAVHAAAAGLASGDGDAAAVVGAACQKVANLGAAFQQACARAAALLACTGDMPKFTLLPANGGFVLAAALLTEEVPWAAAGLQAWSRLAKAPAKAAADMAQHVEALQAALKSTAAALSATLSVVEDALAAVADADAAAAAQGAEAELRAQWRGEQLWGWEPGFDPGAALAELFEEQRATAGRLRALAARSLAALKPLAASR